MHRPSSFFTQLITGFRRPFALAASVVLILFVITVILLKGIPFTGGPFRGRSPSPSGGGAIEVAISVYDLTDRASVQIAHSPEEPPVASIGVNPGLSTVHCSLTPGAYCMRVYGEMGESPWEKIEAMSRKQSRLQMYFVFIVHPPFDALFPRPVKSEENRCYISYQHKFLFMHFF